MSACTHGNEYTHLREQVRRTHIDFDTLHYMEQSLSNFLPLYSKNTRIMNNSYFKDTPISPLERFAPLVTRNLIFINLIVWLAQLVLPKSLGFDITDWGALHFYYGSAAHFYQYITYMFLHSTDSLMHILNNMFMLWMFGSVIERYWGPKRFLIYYLITGITAALTQQIVWAIDLSSVTSGAYQLVNLGDNGIIPVAEFLNMPTTVGASGAVFGLLLAYGMLFPNSEMYYLFLPIPIKAKYIVLLFGAYELFSGVHATGSNVAHFAHLGGMIGGIILILLWRRKKIISGPYN